MSVRCKLGVDGLEARECRAVARELERHPAAALGNAGRHVHQFLHHGPEPAALRLMPDRRVRPGELFKADPAQDIVGEHGARHHQIVGSEFARREGRRRQG